MKKVIPLIAVLSISPAFSIISCTEQMEKIKLSDTPIIKDTSFNISWTLGKQPDFFVYDLAKDKKFTDFVLQNETTKEKQIQIKNLTPFTDYYFRIKYSLNEKHSDYTTLSFKTLLKKPTGLTFNEGTVTTEHLDASWNIDQNAESYTVDLAKDSEFTQYVLQYHDFSVGKTNNVSFNNLTPGVQYFVRIRSHAGNVVSEYSEYDYAYTTPSKPILENASVDSASSFSFSWKQTIGATKYLVDVSTLSDFSVCVSGYKDKIVTGLECNVTGLSAATKYYYRVKAANDWGTSQPSETGEITTLPENPTFPQITDCDFGDIRNFQLQNFTPSMKVVCSNDSCPLSFDNVGNVTFINGCHATETPTVENIELKILDKLDNVLNTATIVCQQALIKVELVDAMHFTEIPDLGYTVHFRMTTNFVKNFYFSADIESQVGPSETGTYWEDIGTQKIGKFELGSGSISKGIGIYDSRDGYYKVKRMTNKIFDSNSNLICTFDIGNLITYIDW